MDAHGRRLAVALARADERRGEAARAVADARAAQLPDEQVHALLVLAGLPGDEVAALLGR